MPVCENRTYGDPTAFAADQEAGGDVSGSKRFYMNYMNSIVSTHVHGLEVRPAFDGNPLSWFGNEEPQIGIGYFSAQILD